MQLPVILANSTKVDETKSATGPGPDNIHAAFIHMVTYLFVSKLFIHFIFGSLMPFTERQYTTGKVKN